MTTPTIPDSHASLIDGDTYVVCTTVMPDGQPQSSVVWWDREGEFIRFNTAAGRQKDKNVRDNPHVTFLAMGAPFFWLEVRGVVEEITEVGGADHIDQLSVKYTGRPYYGDYQQDRKPEDETRVTVKIRPTRIIAFGGH